MYGVHVNSGGQVSLDCRVGENGLAPVQVAGSGSIALYGDPARYAQYGVEGHASCADNFRAALRALGLSCSHVPQPVNFFMHVAVNPDGTVTFAPPQTEAGDYVLLRAFTDLHVVISACPQDWNPATNFHPSALLARVLVRE